MPLAKAREAKAEDHAALLTAGTVWGKDIRLFSALRPRAQGKQGRAQSAAIVEAKATKPVPAPAKAEASMRPKAKAKAAHQTFQEGKDGKEEAKERARDMAKVMARAKERSQTWMTKDGHMWAPEERIGTGQQARNGALQPRPSQDGPLQQPSGHRKPTQPPLRGLRQLSQPGPRAPLLGLAPQEQLHQRPHQGSGA
jgi:hypothetical protein